MAERTLDGMSWADSISGAGMCVYRHGPRSRANTCARMQVHTHTHRARIREKNSVRTQERQLSTGTCSCLPLSFASPPKGFLFLSLGVGEVERARVSLGQSERPVYWSGSWT